MINFAVNEGSPFNQIICAIFINLSGFEYGTTIGWMSPMALLLQSEDSPTGVPLTDIETYLGMITFNLAPKHLYKVSNEQRASKHFFAKISTLLLRINGIILENFTRVLKQLFKISWIASLPYLTCIPANYLVAYVSDRFGRKKTMVMMSVTCAVCWIIKLLSLNIWAFIIARCLVGVSMAGVCVCCPVYTKEVADKNIRGALGCLVSLFFTIGSLFMYVIGDLFNYRTVLWIALIIPIIHIILIMMMPESPSYLIKMGREDEAEKSLSWLRRRGKNHFMIQNEIEAIKSEQKNDAEGDKFLLKAIVKDNILFKAFQIALVAALAREVCGAVPVLNFAGQIFALANGGTGLFLSPNQQAMMLGVVQFTGSLLASSVVERVGRKVLMIVTCLVSGVSMCVLGSWFLARDYEYIASAWIPIITLCLCILCDASGLQCLSMVITGEIFSFKYRGTVLATTMAIASVADFFQLLYFKPLASSIGVHVAFYFFGLMCLLSALYTVIVVPETKGRDLDDIYNDLRGRKNKHKAKDASVECNGGSLPISDSKVAITA